MKSPFKSALSANPKINVAMAMSCSEIMLWKRALPKYVHIYMHLFTCEKLFTNT